MSTFQPLSFLVFSSAFSIPIPPPSQASLLLLLWLLTRLTALCLLLFFKYLFLWLCQVFVVASSFLTKDRMRAPYNEWGVLALDHQGSPSLPSGYLLFHLPFKCWHDPCVSPHLSAFHIQSPFPGDLLRSPLLCWWPPNCDPRLDYFPLIYRLVKEGKGPSPKLHSSSHSLIQVRHEGVILDAPLPSYPSPVHFPALLLSQRLLYRYCCYSRSDKIISPHLHCLPPGMSPQLHLPQRPESEIRLPESGSWVTWATS